MAHSTPQRILQRLETALGRVAASRIFQFALALSVGAFACNAWHRATQLKKHAPEGAKTPDEARQLRHSSEFLGFRRIVQESILRGADHYWTISHIRAYPPFFAIAFAPFGLLPLRLGAALFVALSLFFGLWSVWRCARGSQPAASVPGRAFILFLVSVIFIGSVVARCESDMLVLLPIVGAFALLRKPAWDRSLGAGALLGFAAALKLTPALFGLYLVVQRRWMALLGMAASAILLVAGLGSLVWGPKGNLERHLSWYKIVVQPISQGGPQAPSGRGDGQPIISRPYRNVNQSLTAALFRFLSGKRAHRGEVEQPWELYLNVASLDDRTIFAIANALKLPILALLLFAWWRSARSGQWPPNAAAFGLAVLGCLLLSPVSLHTHHAVLMIPFGVGLAAISGGEQRHSNRVAWALLIALLLMGVTALELGKVLSSLAVADLLLFYVLFRVATAPQPSAGNVR